MSKRGRKLGHKPSAETIAKLRKPKSNEAKANMRASWTPERRQEVALQRRGGKRSDASKNKMKQSKMAEKNPMWKGDDVSYTKLHVWIRRYLKKPELCQICNEAPSIDLSNKTGVYNRDFQNWQYVCRKCHYHFDIEAHRRGSEKKRNRKNEISGC